MIKFKKVRYKNFLSTGQQFIEIDLQKSNTTLVVGENGAGKSTMRSEERRVGKECRSGRSQ